ncbi:MAG: M20/M25/M40 family metallo-hydrolase [Bacteroidales bacterium]
MNYFLPLLFILTTVPVSLPAVPDDPSSLTGILKNHVVILSSDTMEGRGLGTEGKILAKNYIAGEFRSIGLQPVGNGYFQYMDLRIGLARVPGTNVIGYLEGSDPELRDEFIVLGAHYDHLGYVKENKDKIIYPGADDNASGTAVLIELARYFSENRDQLGRSIIFIAFDAEESGLLGAREFINNNDFFDAEKIRLMFSLDMLGMYESNNGLDLRGVGTLDRGRVIAETVAEQTDLRLRSTSADLTPNTDTWPFGESGIPAIHAFTGLDSPYHEPEDTYELIDYVGMVEITRYLEALVTELTTLPELNPSRRFARIQRPYGLRFNTGIMAHTGSTYHQYPDEFFRANGRFTFSAGLFVQLHVGNKFAFQPEILYDYNGSDSEQGPYIRHSLTLPVNFQYNIAGEMEGQVRFYPIAGGYYRYHFSGKVGDQTMDFNNSHPRREWGLNFGIGADIMMVHVAYTRRRTLTDISGQAGSTIHQYGNYFSIGYKF